MNNGFLFESGSGKSTTLQFVIKFKPLKSDIVFSLFFCPENFRNPGRVILSDKLQEARIVQFDRRTWSRVYSHKNVPKDLSTEWENRRIFWQKDNERQSSAT